MHVLRRVEVVLLGLLGLIYLLCCWLNVLLSTILFAIFPIAFGMMSVAVQNVSRRFRRFWRRR